MAAADLGAWVYQSSARRVIWFRHGHFSAVLALDQSKVGPDEGPSLPMQGRIEDVLDMLQIEGGRVAFSDIFLQFEEGPSSLLVFGLDLIDHFPIDGY